MAENYTGRRPRKTVKKVDKYGNVRITLNVSLPEEVYDYLMEKGEREMKSLSTMASLQLKELKEKCERLGL